MSSSGHHPDALTDRAGRVVAAAKLLRRRGRLAAGEFLADGAQAVREAVSAARDEPGVVREIFATAVAAARHVDIIRAALDADITVTEVTDRAAAKLSDAVTAQGLTARCVLPQAARLDDDAASATLDRFLATQPQLLAVLVETSDPGNAGTVIRLADAAGAAGVIIAGHGVDPWGPKAVRGSVGSIFHVPVFRAPDPMHLVGQLRAAGLVSLATTGAAAMDITSPESRDLLRQRTAWLFGSEAHGLPGDVISAATQSVRVPIYGRAESLNLATAAALCLYASAQAQRS